jgi:hypothetical protein
MATSCVADRTAVPVPQTSDVCVTQVPFTTRQAIAPTLSTYKWITSAPAHAYHMRPAPVRERDPVGLRVVVLVVHESSHENRHEGLSLVSLAGRCTAYALASERDDVRGDFPDKTTQ